jgi:hypothetical protein
MQSYWRSVGAMAMIWLVGVPAVGALSATVAGDFGSLGYLVIALFVGVANFLILALSIGSTHFSRMSKSRRLAVVYSVPLAVLFVIGIFAGVRFFASSMFWANACASIAGSWATIAFASRRPV